MKKLTAEDLTFLQWMQASGLLQIIWLVSFLAAMAVAAGKGRFFSGLIWGLLFGPFGLVITLLLPDLKKKQAAQSGNRDADIALAAYQMNKLAAQRANARKNHGA